MHLPAGFLRLDARVLVFALLLSLLAVPLFGLLPSMWGSGLDFTRAFGAAGRSVLGSRGRNLVHGTLLTLQVALTVILLVAAGLMIRSLANVMMTKAGFDPKNVLTMTVDLGRDTLKYRQLLDQLETTPGIEKAGLAAPLFTGWTWYFCVEGEPVPLPDRAPVATYRAASHGYFEAMGIRLLQGRFFNDQDDAKSKPVAIVDETFAKRYWPDGDWIGKRIQDAKSHNSGAAWLEIVGVVAHVKNEGVESKKDYPQIYQALFQRVPSEVSIIVRTKGEPLGFAAPVKNLVYQTAGQRLIFNVRTLEAIQREHSNERRFLTWVLAAFAGTALLLSGVGIYSITRYLVSRRTQEFGVRMALGASRGNILTLVLRKSLLPVLAGAGLGLFGTIALARVLSTLLFGLSPWDPITYMAASLVLAGVALVAGYLPARWAMKVEPMVALRYE
jgi:predicted permease